MKKISKVLSIVILSTLINFIMIVTVFADGAEDWQAFLKEECTNPRTSNHYHEIDDSYIYTDPSTGIILFGIKCGQCKKEYIGDINDFLKCKIYPWSYYAGRSYSMARTMQGYFDEECPQGGYHAFQATYQYSGSDKWKVDMECTKCGRVVNKFYTTTLCDLDNHLTEDYVAYVPTPTPDPEIIIDPDPTPEPDPTPDPGPTPTPETIPYDDTELRERMDEIENRIQSLSENQINDEVCLRLEQLSLSVNQIENRMVDTNNHLAEIEYYTKSVSANTAELVRLSKNDINNEEMLNQLSGNIEDLNTRLTELSIYLGYFFAFMIFIIIVIIFKATWKLIEKYLLNATIK